MTELNLADTDYRPRFWAVRNCCIYRSVQSSLTYGNRLLTHYAFYAIYGFTDFTDCLLFHTLAGLACCTPEKPGLARSMTQNQVKVGSNQV